MPETTIPWCHFSWNGWLGCTHASTGPKGGCEHCYAEFSAPVRVLRSRGEETWGPGAPRHRTSAENWKEPARWNRRAAKLGVRYRVFCMSNADWLDKEVPIAWLADVLEVIRTTPNLDWLLLTKRIGLWRDRVEQARDYVAANWPRIDGPPLCQWIDGWLSGEDVPKHVWMGATAVTQKEVDRDGPKLLAVPAHIHWFSIEPQMEEIDITPLLWGCHEEVEGLCEDCPRDADCVCGFKTRSELGLPRIDWAVTGGESGHKARRFAVDWARSIVQQCLPAGCAPFVKQMGARPMFNGIQKPGQQWPEGTMFGGEVEPGMFQVHLRDAKGEDPSEWPEDLRVRIFPDVKRLVESC